MKRIIRFIIGCFLTGHLILIQGCKNESEIPQLSTFPVFKLTTTTTETGGNVTSSGANAVLSRGLCWNTSPNPTFENSTIYDMTSESGWTGAFTCFLSGLNPGTVYFIRSFAINRIGTPYGGERSFKTQN